jgi:hypothetical protein
MQEKSSPGGGNRKGSKRRLSTHYGCKLIGMQPEQPSNQTIFVSSEKGEQHE